MVPVNSWADLKLKPEMGLDFHQSQGLWPGVRRSKKEFMKLLTQPLAPAKVAEAIEILLEISPYYSYIDRISNDSNLLQPAQLSERAQTSSPLEKEATNLLKKGLGVLEIAIAQQILISGDSLIDISMKRIDEIENSLIEKKSISKEQSEFLKIFKPVLEKNPIFQRNYAAHFINSRMFKNKISKVSMALALAQPDAENIQNALGTIFKAKKDEKNKWFLEILASSTSANFALTSPDEFYRMSKELDTSAELQKLIRLKENTAEKILDFEFLKSPDLTKSELKALNMMLVAERL
jgi:hypothetical protein